MHYVLRPGIVKTQICGVYLLIPNREASISCPNVRRMNLLLAATVEIIEKGEPIEKAYTVYEILAKKTPEEAKRIVNSNLEQLCESGFLIKVEDQ